MNDYSEYFHHDDNIHSLMSSRWPSKEELPQEAFTWAFELFQKQNRKGPKATIIRMMAALKNFSPSSTSPATINGWETWMVPLFDAW